MHVYIATLHCFSFEGTVLIVAVNHGRTPWEINACKSVQVRKCMEVSLTHNKSNLTLPSHVNEWIWVQRCRFDS